MKHKKIQSSPFKYAHGLSNTHLQTLYSSFFRTLPFIDFEKEIFELEDGDFVECFWNNRPNKNLNTPIVVLFHGLEGSYKSPYIKGAIKALESYGFSSVLMHFRGCSGKQNRYARSYHSGDTADAKAWIKHLSLIYPNSDLYAVGYSMGGNMLLKLMGEVKDKALLKVCVAVCAPMKLNICANRMDKGFSKIYQAHLLKTLKNKLLEKYNTHPMEKLIGLKKNEVKNLETFWDFDDIYTAPIHGFSSAKEYYEQSSAVQYLKHIKKETLIIHALDDPFMTPEVLPNENELSKFVKMEIHNHGGHIGFVGGNILKPYYWLENYIASHLFLKNKKAPSENL